MGRGIFRSCDYRCHDRQAYTQVIYGKYEWTILQNEGDQRMDKKRRSKSGVVFK